MRFTCIFFITVCLIKTNYSFGLRFLDKDQDLFDVRKINNKKIDELSKSVFTFIEKKLLISKLNSYEFSLKRSFGQYIQLCKNENFINQLTPGTFCTGFLIGKDIALTAGHCAEDNEIEDFCSKYYIVFDHVTNIDGTVSSALDKKSVFECKSILKRKKDIGVDDYLVLKLSKPAIGRTPLKIRTEGYISNNEKVFTMGYPKGLPLKVTAPAPIINNSEESRFTTAVSTLKGNSGGPIINAKTFEVEGIISAIDGVFPNMPDPKLTGDFIRSDSGKCYNTLVCREKDFCGFSSIVIRSSSILKDFKQKQFLRNI